MGWEWARAADETAASAVRAVRRVQQRPEQRREGVDAAVLCGA